jgi:hypothetical protein
MHKIARLLVPSCLLMAMMVTAQVHLPAPDKDGWIQLFRGDNAKDWYYAYNGDKPPAQAKAAFPGGAFAVVKGDTIAASGNPHGQVYFNQSFSHYRISYEMHFPGNQGNCGMLIHVQENDPPTNGFPRAIESQGDPKQGMGEVWPIGDVWLTIRAKSVGGKMTYVPGAPEVTYGGANWSSRVVAGVDGWGKPDYTVLAKSNGWVKQDVEAYGSDSVIDYVQDTVRIKYRDPRVSSGGTANNVTKRLSAGLIGWQSEGTLTWYRNIKIRLLPGDPLYTPTYAAWNSERTIRPKLTRKVLIINDGTLGFRKTDGNFFDASGRVNTKVLTLTTAPGKH